jgi:hypothetical protein
MSQQAEGGNEGQSKDPRKYILQVDGHEFRTDHAQLTGAQIKALASIDPSYGLFREGHGHGSNEQITDAQIVDLSHPHDNKFFSAPPATFGRAAGR